MSYLVLGFDSVEDVLELRYIVLEGGFAVFGDGDDGEGSSGEQSFGEGHIPSFGKALEVVVEVAGSGVEEFLEDGELHALMGVQEEHDGKRDGGSEDVTIRGAVLLIHRIPHCQILFY